MGTIALFIVGVMILASTISSLAQKFWPSASQKRLTTICGLAIPGVLLLLYPVALIWIWATSSSSKSIDADGMTLVVIGMMLAFSALLAVFVAIPTAHFTLRYLRRK